ncbi:hypothetical protein EAH89_16210 [Roseomonas nepalensis]|uniref:Lipoprotein n=1 Tax=Muricoccus nepalensis TaxID=1854500 RepID=A0A502FVL1_9PROT|nr:hypothetical protein [Roseomonas nepalensis]TPG53515.1 hypothetical protein EAH89_16210 [Roseomonas nepalensis]
MIKTILKASLLPSLALLAACATPPAPTPAVAPPPEEAFRPACEQRFPGATPFAVNKCMFEELDKSRGVTPASATPPEPAPAPARSTAPARSSAPAARRAR